jgi:hypothetical protein
VANNPASTSLSFGSPPAFFVPPNLTLNGTCDTFGNSVFTIKNLGGAMTTSYTWEIYQNNVFLTSGTFLLTAAGTSNDTQQLTINGLYGNVGVKIKNGTTPAAVEILSTTAFCVERPTAFVRQASGQSDPTTSSPIKFAVTFSKPVTGFTNTDVKITGMAATPGITYERIDAGKWAVFRHIGPYNTLWQTWRAIYRDWVPAARPSLRDAAPYELYVSDASVVPAEELITDIHVPVA